MLIVTLNRVVVSGSHEGGHVERPPDIAAATIDRSLPSILSTVVCDWNDSDQLGAEVLRTGIFSGGDRMHKVCLSRCFECKMCLSTMFGILMLDRIYWPDIFAEIKNVLLRCDLSNLFQYY